MDCALKKVPPVEESIEDSISLHNDVKEVFEGQSLIIPESFDTQTHCALKKEPSVEESIEDSISIHNDVKEVLEEQSLILPESFHAEGH